LNGFQYQYLNNTNLLNRVIGYSDYQYNGIGQIRWISESPRGHAFVIYKYGTRGEVLGLYADEQLLIPVLEYTYDEMGNRIKKFDHSSNTITYYVYDPAGKLLSVYDNKGSEGTMEQTELPVYASDRVGVYYKKANNYL